MKKIAIILGLGATVAFCAPVATADDLFGVYAGIGKWRTRSAGQFGVTDTTPNDLGFREEENNVFYLALEHPVPLLPNVLLKYTELTASGNVQLNDTVAFNTISFAAGESLVTDLDLNHTDATLYYEVLDNWLNLDLGLTVRAWDGQLSAAGASQNEMVDLNAILPMAYVKGQFDLPMTGFFVKMDANVISWGGDDISDVAVAMGWNTDTPAFIDVGVELGYRRMRLDLDNLGDLDANLTFDGPFLAINAHF